MRGRMYAAMDPDDEPRSLDDGVGGLAGRNCSITRANESETVSCVEEQQTGDRWSSRLFSRLGFFEGWRGGCQRLNPHVRERYRLAGFSSLSKFYVGPLCLI